MKRISCSDMGRKTLSNVMSVLYQLRAVLMPLVGFSFVTNLSVLVSPLFMMHVLDRVVPTGNVNTLVMLSLLAFVALLTTAVVEFCRDQALGRSAEWAETALVRPILRQDQVSEISVPLTKVAKLRGFLAGAGMLLLLDVPWIPMFLGVLLLIHPAFLVFALIAAAMLWGVAGLASILTKQHRAGAENLRKDGMRSLILAEQTGLPGRLMSVSANLKSNYLRALEGSDIPNCRARRVEHASGAVSRFLRSFFQIGSLALGAFLVTQGSLSAGGMIGASIILGKSVGILDGMSRLIPQLKDLRAAIGSLQDTSPYMTIHQTDVADLSGALNAVNLTIPRGHGRAPRLDRVSFKVKAGECIAIMGESGSGKSTLLEALSGIAPAPIGNCFLDETDVRTLSARTRARAIGYVPQSASTYGGTVSQNIARFSAEPDDKKVLAAARLAGVHGMVSALPEAYETDLTQSGHLLSAGQKQRILFARALYDVPTYLFMDEPNALLDHQSERQMLDAIHRLKSQGTTIVLTAHRLGIVHLCDRIIVMEDGKVVDMGMRSDVLGRMANAHRRLRLPISGGAVQDLSDWVSRQFTRDGDGQFRERAVTVATELFAFGRDNGPENAERLINFEFEFIDDVTCSIMMSEPRHLKIDAKVSKVQERVSMSFPKLEDLNQDERSLAAVMQIAETCEHRAEEDLSAVLATIVDRRPAATMVN